MENYINLIQHIHYSELKLCCCLLGNSACACNANSDLASLNLLTCVKNCDIFAPSPRVLF